jgi:tetratricopeptide (TPR) repeat protein
MRVSRIAIAALPAVCAAMLFGTLPADAQQPGASQPPLALSLSREERLALEALQAAASGTDRATQDAALAAARAAARSADARYALAHYQLEIGRARQDPQMTAQAVDTLVASGRAQPAELPSLLANQASRAYFAGEYERADRLLARVTELDPRNALTLADHAQIKAQLAGALLMAGRRDEAQAGFRQSVEMLRRAITLSSAGPRGAPESWHQRALAIAVQAGLAAESIALAHGLVATYPSPLNWRDALLVYGQTAQDDPALMLDIWRLRRAVGSLGGERDYLEYAQAAVEAGLPGEVKAVLDEGIARGMLDANEPIVRQMNAANNRRVTTDRNGLARLRTQALAAAEAAPALAAGDAHLGHGRNAEAAELYRAALQKSGADADLLNARLGAALALAGQRAEAEAALRAVTGRRADLARFWLAWLAQPPAG